MKYTNLGKSNLQVSQVCLGTMHFGSRTSEEDSFKIMDKALEMGINFFDTANVYGGSGGRGRSEEIIGKWMKERGTRDDIVLATKVFGPMGEENNPNYSAGISTYKVRKHVNESLQRLQTDRIDLYQIHHIDRNITPEEFWGTFERIMNDGKVLYMGGSNFPGWGLATHQLQAMQRGSMGFISEQTMYNLVCRYPELEVLPAAKALGIGVIPYMPLAGGLLTGKKKSVEGSRTNQVENEYGIHLGDANQQMADFSALCAELGEKEHVVAIAWTLAHPAVDSPIVGVRTVDHLDGLDRAAELELDDETLQKLDEIFDPNKGRPLRVGQAPEAYAW
ncbi:MAG: aldo/keto reductase [Anaerolineaceae bacterium]|nr:aldo/keto reductase [Anaerolineae bacterium]MCB9458985.1 aldo/keto reductase [Anaerolineaceae bacterium]